MIAPAGFLRLAAVKSAPRADTSDVVGIRRIAPGIEVHAGRANRGSQEGCEFRDQCKVLGAAQAAPAADDHRGVAEARSLRLFDVASHDPRRTAPPRVRSGDLLDAG